MLHRHRKTTRYNQLRIKLHNLRQKRVQYHAIFLLQQKNHYCRTQLKNVFAKNNNNIFTLVHQNIQSIKAKKEYLELAITELIDEGNKPDAICLSETFIKKGDELNINIYNYELAANYSRVKCRGGTCILLRPGMVFKELFFFERYLVPKVFECCGVEIPFFNLIILCLYNSHRSQSIVFLNKLEAVLFDLSKKYRKRKVIIAGDFNINTLEMTTASKYLKDITKVFNVTLHINEPTRGSSCLDHILSNIKKASGKVVHLQLSDHDTAQMVQFPVKNKPVELKHWYLLIRD